MSRILSSQRIRQLAQAAGFDLCGFARAEPIPPEALTHWLEAGMAADMDWLAARFEERLDVSKLLPEAKSVVALACNYFQPDRATKASPIARYARGRDYHYNLRDRLRAFRRALKELHPDVETYGSIDAGPMMEKVWAARAGLGYVGKNACFITPQFGSYVVLAGLILDAEVDIYAAGPTEDRCGGCNLCINACPTEAITADTFVDARKCLSYQTIENDADVPEPLRFAFKDVVFGCDICQDVCPLNDSPVIGSDRFIPRAVAGLSVREIAAMTREDYDRLVPGTALARAKYDGLRRNAAYALGAARSADALPVLQALVGDASQTVRTAAQWAIARIEGKLPASP